jgi:hypothetical protein
MHKRLDRTQNVLMVISAMFVLLSVATISAGWLSRSRLVLSLGLFSAICILVVNELLLYLMRLAARRGSNEQAGFTAMPEIPPSQIADAFSTHTIRPEAEPSASSSGPIAQRKDFGRRRYRSLSSRHGAYSLEQAGTDRLFILAGSGIGAQHDQDGAPREDDVAFLAEPAAAGAVLAAVADGVSSARLSHLASALAVRQAVNLLSSLLTDRKLSKSALPDWPSVANWVVTKIADELTENRITTHLGDLGMPSVGEHSSRRPGKPATTLAVLVVNETATGLCASWLTVGDCEVATVDMTTGEIQWLTGRAYQSGPVTEALPSKREASGCGQVSITREQAVLAMTDGMAELLDAEPQYTLRALAAARMRDGNALRELLVALDLRLQGVHDDRSVVAVGPIRRS